MSQQKEILLESGTNELEIIEFYIEEQDADTGRPVKRYYGVNVAKVLEVIVSPDLRHSESAAHPCFMGTIPLREKILPVLDLSVWLDLTRVRNDHEVILVTEFHSRITGFLVSGVTQIYRVGWSEVEAPGHYLTTMESLCITGMIRLEDHFVLMLDLEKIIAELDPDFVKEASRETVVSDTAFKALVAEDSKSMRFMISRKLEGANFEVHAVDNGAEAWSRLEALKEKAAQENKRVIDYLDLVVTDVEMPQMDGYALTKRIKEDRAYEGIPVVLFSSIITDKIRHKGESVGADAQVSKPEFDSLADQAVTLIRSIRAKG